MKSLREEGRKAINNFVLKNYPGKTKKETERIIDYHVARFIGKKDDLVVVLKEGEGLLGITKKGNLVDI